MSWMDNVIGATSSGGGGGGGMPTVMFEVYYDDSGEHTPEHLIVTCNKTIDELIATKGGPLFAQAVLWQTNPPANAIAAYASDEGDMTYAEFQFIQIYSDSPEGLGFTRILWNTGLEKWTAEYYDFSLTPST